MSSSHLSTLRLSSRLLHLLLLLSSAMDLLALEGPNVCTVEKTTHAQKKVTQTATKTEPYYQLCSSNISGKCIRYRTIYYTVTRIEQVPVVSTEKVCCAGYKKYGSRCYQCLPGDTASTCTTNDESASDSNRQQGVATPPAATSSICRGESCYRPMTRNRPVLSTSRSTECPQSTPCSISADFLKSNGAHNSLIVGLSALIVLLLALLTVLGVYHVRRVSRLRKQRDRWSRIAALYEAPSTPGSRARSESRLLSECRHSCKPAISEISLRYTALPSSGNGLPTSGNGLPRPPHPPDLECTCPHDSGIYIPNSASEAYELNSELPPYRPNPTSSARIGRDPTYEEMGSVCSSDSRRSEPGLHPLKQQLLQEAIKEEEEQRNDHATDSASTELLKSNEYSRCVKPKSSLTDKYDSSDSEDELPPPPPPAAMMTTSNI